MGSSTIYCFFNKRKFFLEELILLVSGKMLFRIRYELPIALCCSQYEKQQTRNEIPLLFNFAISSIIQYCLTNQIRPIIYNCALPNGLVKSVANHHYSTKMLLQIYRCIRVLNHRAVEASKLEWLNTKQKMNEHECIYKYIWKNMW